MPFLKLYLGYQWTIDSYLFYTEDRRLSAPPYSSDYWSAALMVDLLEHSTICTQDPWNSSTMGSWSHLLLFPQIAHLGWTPETGKKVLAVVDFRMSRGHCSPGNTQCSTNVFS